MCASCRRPAATRCATEEESVVKIDPATSESSRKHIRGAGRLNSRVPLTVEWEDGGKTLQTAGYTVDVSTRGCMAILQEGIPVGQRLRVTNAATKQSAEASVIWRGHEGRSGWEMGLELDADVGDFWGFDF
jgi:hypothetical protein